MGDERLTAIRNRLEKETHTEFIEHAPLDIRYLLRAFEDAQGQVRGLSINERSLLKRLAAVEAENRTLTERAVDFGSHIAIRIVAGAGLYTIWQEFNAALLENLPDFILTETPSWSPDWVCATCGLRQVSLDGDWPEGTAAQEDCPHREEVTRRDYAERQQQQKKAARRKKVPS